MGGIEPGTPIITATLTYLDFTAYRTQNIFGIRARLLFGLYETAKLLFGLYWKKVRIATLH